ncbi:MAG: hypothetical protein AAF662_10030 [Pseudomonadota bacterium]
MAVEQTDTRDLIREIEQYLRNRSDEDLKSMIEDEGMEGWRYNPYIFLEAARRWVEG